MQRLGIEETAEFDEIESARAYLISEYGAHRPSREAIEMAYDKILKERYESRKKTGFRPVDKKTGKRAGGKEETLKERIQKSIDYEVTRCATQCPRRRASAAEFRPPCAVI